MSIWNKYSYSLAALHPWTDPLGYTSCANLFSLAHTREANEAMSKPDPPAKHSYKRGASKSHHCCRRMSFWAASSRGTHCASSSSAFCAQSCRRAANSANENARLPLLANRDSRTTPRLFMRCQSSQGWKRSVIFRFPAGSRKRSGASAIGNAMRTPGSFHAPGGTNIALQHG
jgi:hypothetical protein